MKIVEHDIHWYVNRLATAGDHFALAGYSDAEWYCMLGLREGERTGFGQTLSKAHGALLEDVLKRRHNDPRWLVALPKCLSGLPAFCNGEIDIFLRQHGIELGAVERDMILDDLAREAGLYPLIRQLRRMSVVFVGNWQLCAESLAEVLRWKGSVPVVSPDLHMATDCGIDYAVSRALALLNPGDVCLVSAGVSAAVIIDRLYERKPDCWLMDCGSIWDAFVGIGGQRQWRADLYADPEALHSWKRKNLCGW